VRRAQCELISALRESIESAGLDRTEAEARLSAPGRLTELLKLRSSNFAVIPDTNSSN
jgi:hypothetical protein